MRKAFIILALALLLALFSSLSEAHRPCRRNHCPTPTPTAVPTRRGLDNFSATLPPCARTLVMPACPGGIQTR